MSSGIIWLISFIILLFIIGIILVICEQIEKEKEKIISLSQYCQRVIGLYHEYHDRLCDNGIYQEHVRLNSKRQFDNYNYQKQLSSVIPPKRLHSMILKEEKYRLDWAHYKQAMNLISFSSEEDSLKIGFMYNKVHKVEEWVLEHYSFPKHSDCLLKISISYISPKGRSYYRDSRTFSFSELKSLDQLYIYSENEKREMKRQEKERQRERQKNRTQMTDFMTVQKFNRDYNEYVNDDFSGCYIILIFDHEVTDNNYTDYKDVYVGQSEKVWHRVRQHVTGHGNGDVYADLKYGKYLYIKIMLCMEEEMNDMEKLYIDMYEATRRYNKTAGGSKRR